MKHVLTITEFSEQGSTTWRRVSSLIFLGKNCSCMHEVPIKSYWLGETLGFSLYCLIFTQFLVSYKLFNYPTTFILLSLSLPIVLVLPGSWFNFTLWQETKILKLFLIDGSDDIALDQVPWLSTRSSIYRFPLLFRHFGHYFFYFGHYPQYKETKNRRGS